MADRRLNGQSPRYALVGVGGFAGRHLQWALDLANEGALRYAHQVALPEDRERYAEALAELEHRGITVHSSLNELLERAHAEIDFVDLPIGTALHRTMVEAVLEAGCHALVEKPVAGSIQDVDAMIAARDRTGMHCGVGFQHLYRADVQQLKEWICSGRFGAVNRIGCICRWPRERAYYLRNGWAGRLAVGDVWVLDSPHHNAMAHCLNLMCYLAADRPGVTAELSTITAELYRAHEIESADTVSLRLTTADEVVIHFAGSHCCEEEIHPVFVIETEKAQVRLLWDGGGTITWRDGTEESIPDPQFHHRDVIRQITGVVSGREQAPACSLEIARAQTLCTCGSFESSPVRDLPRDQVTITESDDRVVFNGMSDAIARAHEGFALFSELSLPWATPGSEVSLSGYDFYPTTRAA